eukprot:GHVN01077040.1.p1 GENE.GHVN01077040.1~~GHVN01077040.1.p1  ORF type:complete len:364 (+),score=16.25 GHVN01077040.1:616-1707(+)
MYPRRFEVDTQEESLVIGADRRATNRTILLTRYNLVRAAIDHVLECIRRGRLSFKALLDLGVFAYEGSSIKPVIACETISKAFCARLHDGSAWYGGLTDAPAGRMIESNGLPSSVAELKKIEACLIELLERHPSGIALSQLRYIYEEAFGHPLEFIKFGFVKLAAFLAAKFSHMCTITHSGAYNAVVPTIVPSNNELHHANQSDQSTGESPARQTIFHEQLWDWLQDRSAESSLGSIISFNHILAKWREPLEPIISIYVPNFEKMTDSSCSNSIRPVNETFRERDSAPALEESYWGVKCRALRERSPDSDSLCASTTPTQRASTLSLSPSQSSATIGEGLSPCGSNSFEGARRKSQSPKRGNR